jgi:hypothetical protein
VTKLRKAAQGRECQVRLPCCNGNPETTVGHHIRGTGDGGMGRKPSDLFIAWACSDCHMAIHRQAHTDLDFDFIRAHELEGLVRTQAILVREGLIHG